MDFVFEVDQFPRQPEKYRARNATIAGGGCAATAAVAIARLGGHAKLVTTVGNDPVGEWIMRDLVDDGVDCRFVRRPPDYRSSFSSVFVNRHGDRQITNFREPHPDVDDDTVSSLRTSEFDAALADTRWPQGAAALMKIAKSKGVLGILDAEEPTRLASSALNDASHIVFSATGLRDFANGDDLRAGLLRAEAETGAWVAVTDGDQGVYYIDGNTVKSMPAFRVDAVDTLGAGDVWHGAFALRLAEGRPIGDAMVFANAAAALKCTQRGGRAGIPDRDQAESLQSGTLDSSKRYR